MTARRLIAVSWCMPPALFPRSIQVARTLKGLKALGWTSTVVTPRVDDLAETDPLDYTLSDVYGGQTVARVDNDGLRATRPELLRRWRHRTNDAAPDDDQLWAERAATVVRRLDRAERATALVTFAQPWRDHLVGLELTRWRGRRPWIAHFSDPWADSPYYADLLPEQKKVQHEREAQVIGRADVVVFTNQYAADLVMSKYPNRWRRKIRVVPHAMDRDLLHHVERLIQSNGSARSGPLRLSHVGNLFVGRRTAHALFEALAALRDRRRLEGELELVLMGGGSGWQEAQEKAASLRLDGIVSFRSRASHLESLAAMRDSDVLVLIDAPAATNVFLPSKLADYLMVEKPMLALTPAVGPSADLVLPLGYPVIEPTDVAGISEAIEALWQQHLHGRLHPPANAAAYAERYSLEAIAAAFAEILDDAVRARRG